jgi:hypothetical protein
MGIECIFEKLKEKGMVFLDEKGFCKEGFVLKIVSNTRIRTNHQRV